MINKAQIARDLEVPRQYVYQIVVGDFTLDNVLQAYDAVIGEAEASSKALQEKAERIKLRRAAMAVSEASES